MSDEMKAFVRQWITKAEEDLMVANQLMKIEYPPKGTIGFHYQQSAEKFLKAFLLYHDVDIPRTHNIEFLLEKAKKFDPGLGEIDPGNLTDYGVEARYPGDFLEPSLNELSTLLNIVEDIKNIVSSRVKF
ncbi:MAG: HEPN domain-containing protein [Bacteroidetes bacterium]|nr:HEPN domain-containing protein [Bacteroidota bacterium]